uniref:BTB domain-containing protein n=1 Tax=Panagrellus redivivus TaxID=6233 RepID=A0A7E4VGU0_PANRE
MSISDKSGVAQLTKEIGGLYLSNDFSDVTIVIDGTELPAHRNILSTRCPYFKTMFASGMIESTTKRIELHEIPITGFKSVLKWIYTAEIEFSQMDFALEVYRLSNMYELTDLEDLAVDYVTGNHNIDNLCLILNSSNLLSYYFIDDFVEGHCSEILAHETFVTLSKDALNALLNAFWEDATNIEILEAFVRWMKANPDKAEHFPELLKQIPLKSIKFGELLSIVPAELINANILADVAREQQSMFDSGSVTDVNFAVPKYGAKVIGKNVFLSSRFLKEEDEAEGTDSVIIDLGQCIKLNFLNVATNNELPHAITHSVKVCVSVDNKNWTGIDDKRCSDILDHRITFEFERIVRFIRFTCEYPVTTLIDLTTLIARYNSRTC